jgi:hypothetical protein
LKSIPVKTTTADASLDAKVATEGDAKKRTDTSGMVVSLLASLRPIRVLTSVLLKIKTTDGGKSATDMKAEKRRDADGAKVHLYAEPHAV